MPTLLNQVSWSGKAGFIRCGQVSGPGGLGICWDGDVVVLSPQNGANSYGGATTIGTAGNHANLGGAALVLAGLLIGMRPERVAA